MPIDYRAEAIKALADAGVIYPRNCAHRNAEIRWKLNAIGNKMFRRQCLDCGAAISEQLKHVDVERIAGLLERVQPWDQKAEDQLYERTTEWSRQYSETRTALWEDGKDQRRAEYDVYLASNEWKEKRRLVIARAKGICEGCLNAKATQVHHLTYEHRGAEFLFELVAVCRNCHERLHGE